MAATGDLYLKNASLSDISDAVSSYEETVQDVLYALYKTAYKISCTAYYTGASADAFKSYISEGSLNIVSELMDIASDMTVIIRLIAASFSAYESSSSGKVSEDALDYIEAELSNKKSAFNSIKDELKGAYTAASRYVSARSHSASTIAGGYTAVSNKLKSIREDLYEVDNDCNADVKILYERIKDAYNLINNVMGYCYNSGGTLNSASLDSLISQDWYYQGGNVALYLKLAEEPFEYASGEVTLSEEQWAAGLYSDVYAYAGYSFLSASYEAGTEDGKAYVQGAAALLTASGYAQFTDYLKGQAEVKVLAAEGEVHAGITETYLGAAASVSVTAASAAASAVLGTDDLNVYAKAEASVLSADGKAAFEFDLESGEFAAGLIGDASLAEASASVGFSALNYKYTTYDSEGNETSSGSMSEDLFNVKLSASASAGVAAGVWLEGNTMIETEDFNINAVTINVSAKMLLGIKFSVTVPTIYWKW